jgi:F0F1-type ATP synthase assembly protein I
MERDMYEKIATKSDLKHMRELLSKDIQNLSNSMTIKLGTISGIWVGVLFALLKLTT